MELITKYFPGLTETQYEQLAALEPLYAEWNARINVISRKDLSHLYEKHVLHSMGIAKVFQFAEGASVMDIGTGGGFPGIPLAILFPEARFHLVDSIGKKIKVVQAIRDELHLSNVTTAHNRAEQIRHAPFDYVVSRAVAPLKKLAGWSMPHLKKGKRMQSGLICLKGGDLAEEISESGYKPMVYTLRSYFEEDYFSEKYILFIKRGHPG